ncbi:MAG: hypothetical protein IAF02_20060 [Anaerolineae bacterium]|nr:hypothetical protein [Anaerolineae bacterium]
MAEERTVNAFVPNRGDLMVSLSAVAVQGISGNGTAVADSFSIKGVLVKFERSNNPSRSEESQRVSGHAKPLSFVGGKEETEKWRIQILDDFSKGAAGEWGTENMSAVEIFRWHLDNETPMDGLAATPAGESAGMREYTLDDPIEVLSVGAPTIDSEAKKGDIIEIIVSTPGHTPATRA